MKLKFATIQNSNLKDLISLVKPTSEYSFFNFLYETGRLESHIIANFSFTLRWEYEQYIQKEVYKNYLIPFLYKFYLLQIENLPSDV